MRAGPVVQRRALAPPPRPPPRTLSSLASWHMAKQATQGMVCVTQSPLSPVMGPSAIPYLVRIALRVGPALRPQRQTQE